MSDCIIFKYFSLRFFSSESCSFSRATSLCNDSTVEAVLSARFMSAGDDSAIYAVISPYLSFNNSNLSAGKDFLPFSISEIKFCLQSNRIARSTWVRFLSVLNLFKSICFLFIANIITKISAILFCYIAYIIYLCSVSSVVMPLTRKRV